MTLKRTLAKVKHNEARLPRKADIQAGLEREVVMLKEKLETLSMVSMMGHLMNSLLDEGEIQKRSMEMIIRLVGAESGSLLLIDPMTQELCFAVVLGKAEHKIEQMRLKSGEGIAGWVAKTGKAEIVHDVRQDVRFLGDMDRKSGFVTRSILCVPVEVRGKRVGVLEAINKKKRRFNKNDMEVMKALSDHIAISIHTARLFKRTNETFFNTVLTLGDVIEAKDKYTGGHTRRVMEYSLVIGGCLAMRPDELEHLRIGAVLHDIGKIGIPDCILGKEARLTPEEFEVMKTHSIIGGKIVQHIDVLSGSLSGVRNHHERYDGRGYPDALQGEGVPLNARVIAVCDTFDAMTTDRPYRRGLSVDVALQEMRRVSGAQLDPRIVDTFFLAYTEGRVDSIISSIENAPPHPDWPINLGPFENI